jgi:hypothetical protein
VSLVLERGDDVSSAPGSARRCRACEGPLEQRRGAFQYCESCRARRCPTCRQIGFHVGTHRIGPHRVEPVRYDAISAAELEDVILRSYALAHDAARAIVGDDAALDCANAAVVYALAHRPYLRRINVWYIVQTARTEALMRVRRAKHLLVVEDVDRDVSRSDLIQDTGSPLQWALAWETVDERERVEQARAERAAERTRPLYVPIAEILAAK